MAESLLTAVKYLNGEKMRFIFFFFSFLLAMFSALWVYILFLMLRTGNVILSEPNRIVLLSELLLVLFISILSLTTAILIYIWMLRRYPSRRKIFMLLGESS